MSLIATDVVFGYRAGAPLLRGVTLEVRSGECVAIMAPSGTGKSTLLSVLGGLRKPWAGSVVVGNAESAHPPEISWVFQQMHLMARRTVEENVAIAALSRGASRAEANAAARSQLRRLGIEELGSRPQGSISGGESQRVALARAAVASPDVVLADEPTANLDRGNADLVARILSTQMGRSAVVIATHDPAIAAVATARYVLRDGALEPQGLP